jgi:proton glutamate symport protein
MKFGLYWQITIGLILGFAFGIAFPSTHKITEQTIREIQQKNYPPEVTQIIIHAKSDVKESETEFLKRLKPALGPENFDKYKKDILLLTRYNPFLPYISWMGDIFLRLITMLMVPFVISAIISGISGLRNAQSLGRLGLKTVLYYFITSSMAIFVGLVFVNAIKPGLGFDISIVPRIYEIQANQSITGQIMEIVPTNIFDAFINANLISVIFFSVLFGFFITKIGERNRVILSHFFNSVFEVMVQISGFVIKLLPIAIIGLAASFAAEISGDTSKLINLFASLGKFMLCVLLAFAFHALFVLPIFTYYGFKANPWKLYVKMRAALITAFFTSSSLTALPVSLHSIHKRCGVSNKVSSFTMPLGATFSVEGTALYEIIAVLFIAQAYGMELSLIETTIVIAITLLSSIGSSNMPGTGIYRMSLVLAAAGLPLEGIGFLVATDLILNMFKTVLNVWSDSCCAVIIAKTEGEELKV